MKKIIIGALALVALTSCQDKIAFIDNTKLMDEYQEKKDIEAKLQTTIDNYEKKRDSISRAFQMEAQVFDTEAKKLAQSVAQQKYNQLVQKSQLLQQQLQQEEQKIQLDSQTQMDSLVSKVKKFIKKYGEDNGYTFILGANEGGSVLHGDKSKDITQEVVKAMNSEYNQ